MGHDGNSVSELLGGGYRERGIQSTAGEPTTREELRAAKEYAEMIVDAVREALLVMDLDLRVQSANQSFYDKFQVSPEETGGRLVYELGNGQWDIPELRELLEDILPENKVVDDFEVKQEFEHLGERTMLLNARQMDEHELILLAIEDVTERRNTRRELERLNETLEKEVEKRTKRIRSLSAALTTAEEEERRRIANILHDHIQQLLYGAEMTTRRFRTRTRQLPDSTLKDEQEDFLGRLEETLGEALRDTKTLSVELSPPIAAGRDMVGALEWLSRHMAERYGLTVDLHLDEDLEAPSEDTGAVLFHLVKELLFNVVKHAETKEARLRGKRRGDHLTLRVEDEGKGFDVQALEEKPHSTGLRRMQERLQLLGGKLEVDAAPGGGTRAAIHFVLEEGPGSQVDM